MVVNQYEIYLINLDPTIGREIKKSRPCLVISPNEMNHEIATIIIAPMTTESRSYPSRVELKFKSKKGWIVLDQIRAVDRRRIIKKIGKLTEPKSIEVKSIIHEMLVV